MRVKIIAIFSTFLCVMLLVALTNRQIIERGPLLEPRQTQAVMKRIVSVDCDQMPLQNVLEKLSRDSGVQFAVQWNDLDSANVQKRSPVTLTLRNVTLGLAVEMVLRSIDEPQAHDPLAYDICDGIVVISTRDSLLSTTVMRVYQVGDLVERIEGWEKRQRIHQITNTSSDPAAAAPPGGAGLFGGDSLLQQSNACPMLLELVEAALHAYQKGTRQLLDDGQGREISLTSCGDTLVVIGTPQEQHVVAELIADLRALPTSDAGLAATRPTLDVVEDGLGLREFPHQSDDDLRQIQVRDVDWDNDTLATAAEKLQTAAGIRIVIDPSARDIQLLTAHDTITAHLHNANLVVALNFLLASISQHINPIVWRVHDGAVWVTDAGVVEFPPQMSTRIYDVRDLCGLHQADSAAQLLDILQQKLGNFDRWGQASDPWSAGGEQGERAGAFDGRLVITTTPAKHRIIEQILAALRASGWHPTTRPIDTMPGVSG